MFTPLLSFDGLRIFTESVASNESACITCCFCFDRGFLSRSPDYCDMGVRDLVLLLLLLLSFSAENAIIAP